MATTTKIEYEHVGIATALNRYRLKVPPNQREYAWKTKNVGALFEDLAAAINANKPAYFLGTVVLTRGEGGAVEVVDGQQRLATTTMLLAAIRDYFCEINDRLLVTDLERFLVTIVRATREEPAKLTLNVDDHEFFRRRVLLRPEQKERKKVVPTRPSHELIDNAARMAADHVQAIIRPFSAANRIDALNRWVAFLEESAQVILVFAPDDANAFVMFETLNDRGLRTSQADLVKNYLFRESGSRLPEAQQRWSAMRGTLETLGDDLTLTYLRHFTISRFGYTVERDVFEKIEFKTKGKLPAIQFLDSLAESANDYVAILSPLHSKWNAYEPSMREYVRTLFDLRVAPLRPLMLAVASSFSKRQALVAFRMFVRWAVRLLIAGGARSGTIEQAFATRAEEVTQGRIKSAADLLISTQSVLPADSEFESAFAVAKVSGNNLARYYLRCLELNKQKRPEPEWIPNDDVVVNLEHVLPEKPGQGWDAFDSETIPNYYRRLGNMVLLQASKNSLIGNSPFMEKRTYFKESGFLLTKEVAKERQWGPRQIEERQARLAALAVETWPLGAE